MKERNEQVPISEVLFNQRDFDNFRELTVSFCKSSFYKNKYFQL